MKLKSVIVALAFAITLFSCSTEDTTTQDQSIQKTNVAFVVDQPAQPTTGKQIKRGTIPVWVNTIKIQAVSNVFNEYSVQDTYTFDNQNGAAYIGLDNVAVGSNNFISSTTTDSPQFYQLTNYTVSAGSFNDKFDTALNNIDNENPYVLYNGNTTSTIASTGTNVVTIPMTTLNGRLLSVFQVTDSLKALGLQAKITASVPGLASLNVITKGNELATFKWSDINSIHNKEVTYKVEVSAINNQSVILKTYEIKQKVVGSTSISCYYTIDGDGITFTRNDVKITLNFQEWKNEHCTTCK